MRSLLNSRFRLTTTLAIIITICSRWSAYAATPGDGGAAFLEKLSLSPAPSQSVIVCHGFGCAYRDQLVLTPDRISFLRAALGTPRSARDERKALAGVVAWFDREEGHVAGTVGRVAYAGATTENRPAQMDCIDLTANITEFLIVLDHNGLLKFHHVGEPVSRASSSTEGSRIRRR